MAVPTITTFLSATSAITVRNPRAGGLKYAQPIVYTHGASGDYTEGLLVLSPALQACIDDGFAVITGDFGLVSWANAASITAIATALTAARTVLPGLHASQYLEYGSSMGGAVALVNANLNPTLVKGVYTESAAIDFNDIYVNRYAGLGGDLRTAMDLAYTDHTGFTAALPTRSPVNLASALKTQFGTKLFLVYGWDDPVCNGPISQTFVNTSGARSLQVTGVGHFSFASGLLDKNTARDHFKRCLST